MWAYRNNDAVNENRGVQFESSKQLDQQRKCVARMTQKAAFRTHTRVRQLYKNISMLLMFPVKDGKLSTGVNATFNASCYG